MKKQGIFLALLLLASGANAQPRMHFSVPLRWGVYVADVGRAQVRSIGNFYDWKSSPDGRFIVGGRDVGSKKPFYEISVVSTSMGASSRLLERFPVSEEMGAGFKWSPASSRVSVSTDRNGDGKSETKTFVVARHNSHSISPQRERRLSASALRRLKARFSFVSEVTFSPDGKRVAAYLSRSSYIKADFDGGLWMFRPDGTGLRRITRNAPLSRRDLQTGVPLDSHNLQDREPHWLDSTRLAFRRGSFEEET